MGDIDIEMADSTEQGEPTAGPSNHARALVDAEDERVTVLHPTAGKVIRMDHTLHDLWRRKFGGDLSPDHSGDIGDSDKFLPFASELDWQIASWAVLEGIGHKSFDRLLAIPGVSYFQ